MVKITGSLADKQTDIIFRDVYLHVQKGPNNGFRTEMFSYFMRDLEVPK